MRSCHRVELFTSSHQSNTSPSACACSGIAMESSPPGSDVTAVARRDPMSRRSLAGDSRSERGFERGTQKAMAEICSFENKREK
ncbi:hypothetical protein GW17_00037669 [Ensete ventricosum]|nr:hypothetical protein GW17_00037669 [Ensete ventricosum]